jgi:hypothetical protein
MIMSEVLTVDGNLYQVTVVDELPDSGELVITDSIIYNDEPCYVTIVADYDELGSLLYAKIETIEAIAADLRARGFLPQADLLREGRIS